MRRRTGILIGAVLIAVIVVGVNIVIHLNTTSRANQRSQTNQHTTSIPDTDVLQLGKPDSAWQNGSGTPSDGKDTNAQRRPTRQLTNSAKQIIIYFSRSGSTEMLADKIAADTGADMLEIVVRDTYSGNYQKTLARANAERESDDYPALNMDVPDLSQYDTVYLGYPIWAMTLAHPMTAFLTEYGDRLGAKKIAPFMSQGGYGQGDSVNRIENILKSDGASNNIMTSALVIDGNKINKVDEQVENWVKRVQS